MTKAIQRRIAHLTEVLRDAEAECTRYVITAVREAEDPDPAAEERMARNLDEAFKHGRIAAQIKRQLAQLQGEVTL